MPKFKNFVTLHAHPASLDSASTVEEFVKRTAELGNKYVTMTDHGYMGATMDVHKAAKEAGLKSITGIEAYHRDDEDPILIEAGIPKEEIKKYYKYGHLCLHCLDFEAYQKMIKLLSDRDLTAEAHGSERKPIFSWQDLEYLGQYNITATSGCLARNSC
jgi:DNA polymerase III alpha subunit